MCSCDVYICVRVLCVCAAVCISLLPPIQSSHSVEGSRPCPVSMDRSRQGSHSALEHWRWRFLSEFKCTSSETRSPIFSFSHTEMVTVVKPSLPWPLPD